MSRAPSALGVLSAALALASCASGPSSTSESAAALERDVAERAGAPLAAPGADPLNGALPAEARALLADGLTEDDAVKIALLNNGRVRARFERLGVARADLVRAGLLSNPVFSGNAKFFEDGREIELELVESFVELFFVPLRKSVAAADLREREAEVKRAVVALAFDVRRAFVDVRAAQDSEQVRRRMLVAAESARDLMEQLHRAGNVTDPELTAEVVALGSARLDAADAIADARLAREELNLLLGLWGADTEWTISGRLAELPPQDAGLDDVEGRAVGRSLAIAADRARAESAAQRGNLGSWEPYLRSAEVGVAAKQESAAGWGFGPAFRIPLPFFDRGQAAIAAAEAELRAALNDVAASAVETRAAARAFRERVLSSAERARFLREAQLPSAARLVRETLQNYNAMQIGAFDVLSAKRRELDVEAEHVSALRELAVARLDLAELLAGNLNDERLSDATHGTGAARAPRRGDHAAGDSKGAHR